MLSKKHPPLRFVESGWLAFGETKTTPDVKSASVLQMSGGCVGEFVQFVGAVGILLMIVGFSLLGVETKEENGRQTITGLAVLHVLGFWVLLILAFLAGHYGWLNI
jgi:hypothetical protein